MQHGSFSISFGVSDGSGICGLCYEQIWAESRCWGSSEMSVCVGIVVASVEDRQPCVFYMEHASAQHMASIIRSHLHSIYFDRLKQANTLYLICRTSHFTCRKNIKLFLFLLLVDDFPVIFKHQWQESLCWCWCQYRPRVAVMLCEIRQGSAVIEMEMREDDQVNCLIDGIRSCVELWKIRIPAIVSIEHVYSDIKYNSLILKRDADTRAADVLPRA